jgi:hypothetical protein
MFKRSLGATIALLFLFGAVMAVPGVASAAKKSKKPLVVCKFGCKYKTIQSAVDKVKKGGKIYVLEGKYKEGVILEGHKKDDVTIQGMKQKKNGKYKKAKANKVILEGKNAKNENGLAQNGIEGIDVNGLVVKNMWARNYATNGFFVRDSQPAGDASNGKIDCNDYVFKNTIASDNRSYGVYAFGCAGGKMLKSEGYGHGDSAFYVGASPPQDDPKTTILKNLDAHENVLGYSGTNSRYIKITNSDWYNNGVGIVPNTLDSEPFEPTADSVIENNNVFWNNFNYFLPNSGVETVSNGLGTIDLGSGPQTLQYPTGVGIALFGAQGWVVQNNNVFGNFKFGVAAFSDPFNEGDDAISRNNQIINNAMGRDGTDINAVDFWIDGSGSGNCFSGNNSSTFDPADGATVEQLYPTCPAPAAPNPGASNASFGNLDQVTELVDYVATDPPENQECKWTQHPHPPFEDFEPVDVTPDPSCP